jgi:hypothetical protein
VTESWAWLASGTGNVLLALLAGAGGSALLELLWRPRRDARRAAVLLVSEVALNTEILLLFAHVRQTNPKNIPADFSLSTVAWEAAAGLVSELPPALVRRLVLQYHHYASLNSHVGLFSAALDARDVAPPESAERAKSERLIISIIDVFNMGVDRCIHRGQAMIPLLVGLARIKEDIENNAGAIDYAKRAAALLSEREKRMEGFRRRFGKP